MINEKPMSWNSATKRWDELETPSSGVPSEGHSNTPGAMADTIPTLLLIPRPTTYAAPTNTDAMTDAAKTDSKEQIRIQMLALKNQYESL